MKSHQSIGGVSAESPCSHDRNGCRYCPTFVHCAAILGGRFRQNQSDGLRPSGAGGPCAFIAPTRECAFKIGTVAY